MKFKCPKCETIISVSYSYLGVQIECPKCCTISPCEHTNIINWEMSGYEIPYDKFVELLNSDSGRKAISSKIEKWFKCKIVNQNDKVLIYNNNNDVLLPLEIHFSIQNQRYRRKDIYQLAMSIWR